MHELAIAMNIVEIAEEKAKESGVEKVLEIELEIGTLSGVVLEALEFAMAEAVKESVLEGAGLRIETTQGRGKCNECGKEFIIEDLYTNCPDCQSFDIEIIAGQELRVKAIYVE